MVMVVVVSACSVEPNENRVLFPTSSFDLSGNVRIVLRLLVASSPHLQSADDLHRLPVNYPF